MVDHDVVMSYQRHKKESEPKKGRRKEHEDVHVYVQKSALPQTVVFPTIALPPSKLVAAEVDAN